MEAFTLEIHFLRAGVRPPHAGSLIPDPQMVSITARTDPESRNSHQTCSSGSDRIHQTQEPVRSPDRSLIGWIGGLQISQTNVADSVTGALWELYDITQHSAAPANQTAPNVYSLVFI